MQFLSRSMRRLVALAPVPESQHEASPCERAASRLCEASRHCEANCAGLSYALRRPRCRLCRRGSHGNSNPCPPAAGRRQCAVTRPVRASRASQRFGASAGFGPPVHNTPDQLPLMRRYTHRVHNTARSACVAMTVQCAAAESGRTPGDVSAGSSVKFAPSPPRERSSLLARRSRLPQSPPARLPDLALLLLKEAPNSGPRSPKGSAIPIRSVALTPPLPPPRPVPPHRPLSTQSYGLQYNRAITHHPSQSYRMLETERPFSSANQWYGSTAATAHHQQ